MTQRALLVPALTLTLLACTVENRTSVQIRGRAAPSSDTECEFEPGGEFAGVDATLDVSTQFTGLRGYLSYSLPVYVDNNLAAPSSTSDANLDATKAFTVVAAKVRVNPGDYDVHPNPPLLPVPANAQNTIPLDGQTIGPGGKTVFLVDAISPALGQIIADAFHQQQSAIRTIVLGITIQGHTLDGESLESGEWFYAVDVCDGCLLTLAGSATFISDCRTANGTPVVTGCAGFGQDFPPGCLVP